MIAKDLVLVLPCEKYKKQLIEYRDEFLSTSVSIGGAGGLERYEINEWLETIEDHRLNRNIGPGRVPSTLYLTIRKKDDRIIGTVDIRHQLNDYLLFAGGHIGYGVRPSERKKGYGTLQLDLALSKCRSMNLDKVLVTCNKNNIGSAKIILNNGGVLENEVVEKDKENNIVSRYWISL